MKKKITLVSVFGVLIIGIILIYMYINKIWIFNPYLNVDIDPKNLYNNINDNVELPSMNKLNEEEVLMLYDNLDLTKIASYDVNSSFINITADEISIFKVKDKRYLDELKEILAKRAKDIEESFKDYIYAQFVIAQNYKIKEYGDVIILVINENTEEIFGVIENNIKQ